VGFLSKFHKWVGPNKLPLFSPYSISQFSTLLVYLGLLIYEIGPTHLWNLNKRVYSFIWHLINYLRVLIFCIDQIVHVWLCCLLSQLLNLNRSSWWAILAPLCLWTIFCLSPNFLFKSPSTHCGYTFDCYQVAYLFYQRTIYALNRKTFNLFCSCMIWCSKKKLENDENVVIKKVYIILKNVLVGLFWTLSSFSIKC